MIELITSAPTVQTEACDSITVMHALEGRRMTKLIRMEAGAYHVDAYDSAEVYNARRVPLTGLDDIKTLLASLASNPNRFVVRGEPVRAGEGIIAGITRRLTINPNTGARPGLKTAPHRWLALDIDKMPLPVGTDARDLKLCALVAMDMLPPEFTGARCLVQATSSHGIKPGANLRLWFWLSRPVSDTEAKAWMDGIPVDRSIFGGAQPIYTAAPVFADGLKDHLSLRLDDLAGAAEVEVPSVIYTPTGAAAASDPTATLEDITSALATMANGPGINWDGWNDVGMAAWRSSGAAPEALEAWINWSAKNPKHDPAACEERWEHYSSSPPSSIGFGTLVHFARQADPDWQKPSSPSYSRC